MDLLEAGRTSDMLELIDAHVRRLASVLPQIFQNVANDEMNSYIRKAIRIDVTTGAVSFDATEPRVVATMRNHQLQFIRGLTRQQREVVQDVLTESLRAGRDSRATARAIREVIGLTRHQRQTVTNYRRLLERGRLNEALDRELRDHRFDPSLERGQPLSPAHITRMVDRYRARLLALRATTIARTETQRVFNQARHEALLQMLQQTGIEPSSVRRVWRSTRDSRVRDTHRSMDGQEVGIDQPFLSPSGASLMYPGDPSAPAAETISCRCFVTTTGPSP